MQLEKIPTTKHGKVKRSDLPAINAENENIEQLKQPIDELQIKLRALWAKVLNIEAKRVGLESSFFQLGGHSLKAIRLLSLIQKDFGVNFEIQQIFQNPTLEGMAKQLKALLWLNKTEATINLETRKIII